jgi:hypothetical protein
MLVMSLAGIEAGSGKQDQVSTLLDLRDYQLDKELLEED